MTTIVRPHGAAILVNKLTTCHGCKRMFPKAYRKCPYCKKAQKAAK